MRFTRSVAITALSLVLGLAGTAAAQQAPAGGPVGRILHCLSILGLTDQQKADIKQVFDAEKPVLAGLLQTAKSDREALRTLLDATTPDPCAVGAAALKVHADDAAVKAELAKIRDAVAALLTAEQKAKLEGCLQAPMHTGPASQAVLGDHLGSGE